MRLEVRDQRLRREWHGDCSDVFQLGPRRGSALEPGHESLAQVVLVSGEANALASCSIAERNHLLAEKRMFSDDVSNRMPRTARWYQFVDPRHSRKGPASRGGRRRRRPSVKVEGFQSSALSWAATTPPGTAETTCCLSTRRRSARLARELP